MTTNEMAVSANSRSMALRDPLPGIVAVRYDAALDQAGDAETGERWDEALASLEMAARLAPRRALPWSWRGIILLGLDRADEAVASFDEALLRDPGDAAAVEGKAAALAHIAGWAIPAAAERRRFARVRAPSGALLAVALLAPFLIGLAVAELAVTYLNPVLVFPLHGGLAALVAGQLVLTSRWRDEEGRTSALVPLLLTLVLAPLIRLISLTLPLAVIEPAYRYLFAGIPMALGAILAASAIGFTPRQIGLVWRAGRWQIFAVVVSVGLGFTEFAILRPAPLGPLPWMAGGILPALAVGLATGLPEELIFRGVMQTAARPLLGRWNVLFVALVFAVLHIGYASAVDLAFVFGVGLLYGWLFERTRSIIGVSIGHGIANVVLFFVAPYLAGLA